MRILLISPYHTGSHAAWAEGFTAASRHDVALLSMAGRFWKWRMQGGALELAQQVKSECEAHGPPDVLLATDMVNLPALVALARPWLNDAPALLYMHENQLTYPPPPGEKRDLTYGMINVLSMACANRIAFNSVFHRDEFFAELSRLLKHFPDYNRLEIIPELSARSLILPVGIDLARFDDDRPPPCPESSPLRILWNQRWEYDKNPADFFDALYALQATGLPFEVVIAGENFSQQPIEFLEAQERLGERIIHFGFADDRRTYHRLLWESDLVVSTALHEFFGVSILEALYCGCYPLLPNRLSYPELLAVAPHHLYDDFDELAARLCWAAANPALVRTTELSDLAQPYDWRNLASTYDALLEKLTRSR
ncbi:MAG: DUF3524 domain-containing protein [Caldilineales bacterium]|nr:DUF3524 domain-containing protein [Caldilineales bacterium]